MNFISLLNIIAILVLHSIGQKSQHCLPSSCAEIALQGNRMSGIYTIHPRRWFNPTPFQVYCDMETDGSGWTVFQRRDDFELRQEIRENFTRNWTDYKYGFGDLKKEFWLGNDFLYILTNQDRVKLRIDLQDFDGNSRVAEYENFHIDNANSDYNLTIHRYHGDAGDSLAVHSHSTFVTFDKNDVHKCATNYKGGWWYYTTTYSCYNANLNGVYAKGKHSGNVGINWNHWLGNAYSLKRIEMKIRPVLDEYYHSCLFNGCPEICQNENRNAEKQEQELQPCKQVTPIPLK